MSVSYTHLTLYQNIQVMTNQNKTDIGLIGLAVMGENLALNMESKGWYVSVYNRTAVSYTHLNPFISSL